MGGTVSRLFGRKHDNESKPKVKKPRRFGSLRRQRTDEQPVGTRVSRSSTMPSRTHRSKNEEEAVATPTLSEAEHQRLEERQETMREVMETEVVTQPVIVQQIEAPVCRVEPIHIAATESVKGTMEARAFSATYVIPSSAMVLENVSPIVTPENVETSPKVETAVLITEEAQHLETEHVDPMKQTTSSELDEVSHEVIMKQSSTDKTSEEHMIVMEQATETRLSPQVIEQQKEITLEQDVQPSDKELESARLIEENDVLASSVHVCEETAPVDSKVHSEEAHEEASREEAITDQSKQHVEQFGTNSVSTEELTGETSAKHENEATILQESDPIESQNDITVPMESAEHSKEGLVRTAEQVEEFQEDSQFSISAQLVEEQVEVTGHEKEDAEVSSGPAVSLEDENQEEELLKPGGNEVIPSETEEHAAEANEESMADTVPQNQELHKVLEWSAAEQLGENEPESHDLPQEGVGSVEEAVNESNEQRDLMASTEPSEECIVDEDEQTKAPHEVLECSTTEQPGENEPESHGLPQEGAGSVEEAVNESNEQRELMASTEPSEECIVDEDEQTKAPHEVSECSATEQPGENEPESHDLPQEGAEFSQAEEADAKPIEESSTGESPDQLEEHHADLTDQHSEENDEPLHNSENLGNMTCTEGEFDSNTEKPEELVHQDLKSDHPEHDFETEKMIKKDDDADNDGQIKEELIDESVTSYSKENDELGVREETDNVLPTSEESVSTTHKEVEDNLVQSTSEEGLPSETGDQHFYNGLSQNDEPLHEPPPHLEDVPPSHGESNPQEFDSTKGNEYEDGSVGGTEGLEHSVAEKLAVTSNPDYAEQETTIGLNINGD